MKYGIVLTYTVTQRWLALSREQRNAMRATHLEPVFATYADRVRARFFDAEAFNGRFSDFVVLETEDLGAYYFLVEGLRDTPVVSEGYLTFGEIFLGVEDGFQAYEQAQGSRTESR